MRKLEKRRLLIILGIGLGILQVHSLAAQKISFQYGSIPFGKSENFIISRFTEDRIKQHESPTAQFLSSGVIIKEDFTNPVYTFFNDGIRKTVSWGDAYVDLYGEYVKRIDLNPPGETAVDCYFYNNKLFLVHKSVRAEGRYTKAFENLLTPLTDRIGGSPVTGGTRFRGFSYELYAEYAFWQSEDTTIFVLVREKNFQSKVSTIEYVYIDTELWDIYKQRIKSSTQNEKDVLGDF